MGNKFYSLPNCYWLFVPVALSLSCSPPPNSTHTRPHPGVKEAKLACTSHWRKSFEHLQPRGSWGSSCVCYYPICMTILQLQVLPEDANKNRVPRHFAFESKLSPFPARWGCCKPTQSLDQSWWGRPHPSHAGIYKGFISVGIRYRIKGVGGAFSPLHKTIIKGKMRTKETLVAWLLRFAASASRPFHCAVGKRKYYWMF